MVYLEICINPQMFNLEIKTFGTGNGESYTFTLLVGGELDSIITPVVGSTMAWLRFYHLHRRF